MSAKAGTPCNMRLLSLLRLGYSINPNHAGASDVIDLRHPAVKRIAHGESGLYLLADGTILTGRSDDAGLPVTIPPDDAEGFYSLASRIPPPTWRERNGKRLLNAFGMIIVTAAYIALFILLT